MDFNVGHLTLVLLPKGDNRIPQMYVKELKSMTCFNTAIEWNKAYFQKIRMCFYRRLADI